ncbi:MAG: hypothetical protein MJE66_25835 [Proteobacteria bacterium]|nr:hypothetical protein [Pseudomonadota bacterium]
MPEVERRPSSGSCERCRASLGLASLSRQGVWYCSTACAEGRPTGTARTPAVPEEWLYSRPRRFYRQRAPKELKRGRG